MADISGYLKSKLDKFKAAVSGPNTPPPQVDFSKYNMTPRVQQSIQQTRPLIEQAQQQYQASRIPRMITNQALNVGGAVGGAVENYFKPVPQVRLRDFGRELYGMTAKPTVDLSAALVAPKLVTQQQLPRVTESLVGGVYTKPSFVNDLLTYGTAIPIPGGAAPAIAARLGKPLAKAALKGVVKKGATTALRGAAGRFAGSAALESAELTPQIINKIASPTAQLKAARKYIRQIAESATEPGDITRAVKGVFENVPGGGYKRQQLMQTGMEAFKRQRNALSSQGGGINFGEIFDAGKRLVGKGDDELTNLTKRKAALEQLRYSNPGDNALVRSIAKLEQKISQLKSGQQLSVTGPGEKIYKIIKEEGIADVKGKPVKIVDGIETFIHQGDNPKRTIKGFIVSEKSTGRYLASGETEREAITNAKNAIEKAGDDKFKALLAEHRLPQDASAMSKAETKLVERTSPQPLVTGQPESLPQPGKAPTGYATNADGKIDRTKLTGKALGYTNEELLTGKLRPREQKLLKGNLSKRSLRPLDQLGLSDSSVANKGASQTSIGKAPQTLGQQLTPPPQGPARPYNDIIKNHGEITPRDKVGIFDYLRTPDRVLQKIGLGKQADLLRTQYNKYLQELPVEIERISQWIKRVPDPESNIRIFHYLDGRGVPLNPQELQVATEIQGYLAQWADRLKLPKDQRIASYITHIFDEDFIQKEFDPDLAKLIRDKVPGSVYDPFLEQRLGKKGYVEDTWRALDAYVKRATRKANIDPALAPIKEASKHLEESQFNYVKRYIDKVNMRPGEVDNLVDNTIKQFVGYRFGGRPVARISRTMRNWVYRGTLGLNVGSAVRNLTQGINTYSKLGEKYTIIGYSKLMKHMATNDWDELKRVGVLSDNIVQDRRLSAVKSVMERADKVLWAVFDTAEKINRGSAYFGAKSRALAKGLNEEAAIKEALKLVRDTQFTFGSIDTPVALQNDMLKVLTQFQSFNVKQTEFLTEMLTNKEWAGMARFIGANAVLLTTVGQALGYDWKNAVPFSGVITGDTKIGATPPVQLVGTALKYATGGTDKFGQPLDALDVAKTAVPFIPAGVQGKKTAEGILAAKRGYSQSKSGRARYPIGSDALDVTRTAIMGQYSGKVARFYFDNNITPLGDKDTAELKRKVQAGDDPNRAYYSLFVQKVGRSEATQEEKDRLIEGMRQVLGINDAGAAEIGTEMPAMPSPLPKIEGGSVTTQQKKDNLQRVKDIIKGGMTGKGADIALMEAGAVKIENGGRMGSLYYWQDEDGKFQHIDLAEYKLDPAKPYLAGKQEKEMFAALSKIDRTGGDERLVRRALGDLGVSEDDLDYYQVAREAADVRVSFATEMLEGGQGGAIEVLSPLRREVGGKQVLTNAAVDSLYNDGLITSQEKAALKRIDFDKKTGQMKVKALKGKKPKKPKKLSIRKVSPARVSKVASSIGRSPKPKLTKIRLGKATTGTFKLRKQPKFDTVESFKRKLLARRA